VISKIIISLLIYQFTYLCLHAEDVIVFSNENSIINIGKNMMIYEDSSSNLDIYAINDCTTFEKSSLLIPNLGTNQNPFWLKFKLTNMSDVTDLVLNIECPTLNKVEIYKYIEYNRFDSLSMGEALPFKNRIYNYPNFIVDLNISKGDTALFFLKIQSNDIKVLPINIARKKTLFNNLTNRDILIGTYLGIMFVMFLYNLFVYFSTKDKSYLFYIVYVLTFGITQISILGYAYKYFWPNSPEFSNFSIILFSCLSGISAGVFQVKFLKIKEFFPRFYMIFYPFYGLYMLSVLTYLFGAKQMAYDLLNINGLPYTLLMLFFAIYITIKGYRPAKFFLISWSFLLIGIFVYVLRNFGVLPYNIFTSFSMQFGSAMETVLLSFALADRINILRKEKEDAQQETIVAIKKNEQLIQSQNIILEKEVKDRTVALETSNKDLNNALKELKNAQSQLVDSEKMASLGQLTAGIAHEINNPINFVVANITPLKRDLNDILSVLKKYSEIKEDTDLKIKLQEIEQLKSDLDTDYLIEEIESLLNGINDGAIRTAEIVKGLKVFSSVDATGLKQADINEGLSSTLVLLKNKISNKITIEELYGDIPKVECYIGKLNQAFMNILDNAIYEVAHKEEGERKIIISTSVSDDNIIIKIEDTANGMDETTKSKLFEPFFTTKDVGHGTGLGLSIVYNIIELHHGKIEIDSVIGKGTIFTITLPIKQDV